MRADAAVFAILALVTLAGAIAAMTLRNLIHCALCLVVTFVGLAALYLNLGAQFVGLAQILVYVGAVAILVVFAILMTRGGDAGGRRATARSTWIGVGIAGLVFGCLAAALLGSQALSGRTAGVPSATVQEIGTRLMTDYVLPLQAVGLLLTAALLGAVIIALPERRSK
jgi:NADH-quinone oxidoreductase subunit J